ncbi:MAG TPA: DUF11 domain-containing protein [Thermoanaerobaculia bacterium]
MTATPTDLVTIGSGTQSGSSIDVPVYIRDTSGSPLGIDQPAGSRIQSYSIKVNYSPAAPIQSVTFTRAGITSPLTPAFESSPAGAGTISLIDTFQESTNLIPFTSNAPAPGNQVAHLVFTFAPGTADGTVVTLTLDPTLTQLSNEAGTTSETTSNAELTLTNSSITFSNPAADLSITNTPSSGPYGTGLPITYTITVSNAGPGPASGATMSDVIPAGTTFVSATPAQGSCSGTSTVTCSLGTIASGGSATIALTLTLPSIPGPVSDTASASATTPDSNATNNSSTSVVVVAAAAAIPTLSPLLLSLLALSVAAIGVRRIVR